MVLTAANTASVDEDGDAEMVEFNPLVALTVELANEDEEDANDEGDDEAEEEDSSSTALVSAGGGLESEPAVTVT